MTRSQLWSKRAPSLCSRLPLSLFPTFTSCKRHLSTQSPKSTVRTTNQSNRNILITAALPYVNNVPHLGNLIGAILSADIYARYQKLYPSHLRNVRFICGTDEFGTATETRARQENTTPDKLCEKYYWKHKELYEWFEIDFDAFGRTSQGDSHKAVVASIYRDLENEGFFFEKEMQQLYCENDGMYLADRFVKGECPSCGSEANGDQCDQCGTVFDSALDLNHARCAVCSTIPVAKSTRHLFLDIPKGRGKLKQWFESLMSREESEGSEKTVQWSSVARRITQGLLRDNVPPRCITRDLTWGTPVPYHEKRGDRFGHKVFYVWFDAPIGYISIMAEHFADWKDWWFTKHDDGTASPPVEYIQFMGKDNVPFHSMYFPLMLLGTQKPWKLVDALVSTHYLNYEDGKFSKSKGTGVFCDSAKESGIPSSLWRFYLTTVRPELNDSSFHWSDFADKVNNVLLAKFGNYFNRVTKFTSTRFEGRVPEKRTPLTERDEAFIRDVSQHLEMYINSMEQAKLKDGQQVCMNLSQIGNQYMQDTQPWALIKEDKDRVATTMNLQIQVVALLSIMIRPFMPTIGAQMHSQLNLGPNQPIGFSSENPQFDVDFVKGGHEFGELSILFKKLDTETVEELKVKYGAPQGMSDEAAGQGRMESP
mmetsp:Transcript_385/g.1468  ORF Transcript_385/g.1468 Transcript_385/m.1468 type:complete len:651 (-) Transcript_385:175-2127(-)